MVVQSTLINSTMSLKYKAGIDALGQDIIKAKKFSNVKVTAAADDLLFIGTALSSLMKYEVVEILRSDDSTLVSA